ncbi:MAG: DUF305 domain-containing protein, partial [Xanthobacteraceae bacterium]
MHKHAYFRLAAMTALSFVAMYVLMYAMVDRFENVFPNVNKIYMAGLMTAPMVIFELALMGAMYKNRAANIAIYALSIVALIGCWAAVRMQLAVGDTQFLKSMIPHHASAVLMCERAPISDPEIRQLCATIIKG